MQNYIHPALWVVAAVCAIAALLGFHPQVSVAVGLLAGSIAELAGG